MNAGSLHYEYLASITLVKNELVLTSERGRVYALDIQTKALRRMEPKEPNKPAAGNAGIASQLAIETHWPGVPESER